MATVKSQIDAIKYHLEIYGNITSLEAIELYGCTRLSAKIYDLKKDGVNITKQMEKGKNRFGRVVKYARYYLVKEKKNGRK